MANFSEVRRAQLANSALLIPMLGAPGIFPYLLWSVQMLKREWSAGSKEKLPSLFTPSQTATLVPEFAVEDLTLGRTAALVSELAMKD